MNERAILYDERNDTYLLSRSRWAIPLLSPRAGRSSSSFHWMLVVVEPKDPRCAPSYSSQVEGCLRGTFMADSGRCSSNPHARKSREKQKLARDLDTRPRAAACF